MIIKTSNIVCRFMVYSPYIKAVRVMFLLSLVVFLFLFNEAGAQNLRQIIKDRAVEALKNQGVEMLKKSRNEYDETEFNYAVSFSDNSGMFEAEERFRRLERGLLYVLSPESYSNRSPREKALDLNEAGEMFYASGRYRSAELAFNSSLVIYRASDLEHSKEAASVISNLGLLYHASGRYVLAEKFTLEARDIRQNALKDEATTGVSHNNLAVLYKDMGRYAEAQELFDQAVANVALHDGTNSIPYSIVLNNQAIFYQVTGRYREAEVLLIRAIEVASGQLGDKSSNFLRMKVNLALLCQVLEEYEKAEELYLEAISVKRRRLGSGHPDYAVMLRNIASLYLVTGELDKVEKNLKDAMEIYKRRFGSDNLHYAATSSELGSFYMILGDTSKALPLLEEAISIEGELLDSHHPGYVASLERMAVLKWQEGDYAEAYRVYGDVMDKYLYQIDTHFPAMSENEKARFWAGIQPKFVRFNSFAIEAEKHVAGITGDMFDYHIAVKALLLSSTTKVRNGILMSGDSDLTEKFQNWLDIKEYLSYLYTIPKSELKQDRINIDSLENEANRKERELSRLSELFGNEFSEKRVSYRDISSALHENEAAMEIIRFRKYNYLLPDTAVYYAALLVAANEQTPVQCIFRNGNLMETSYAADYKKIMERAMENDELYKIYWGELEGLTAGYSDIFFSADGIFNQINIQTLKNDKGQYLLENKKIKYLPNTRLLAGGSREKSVAAGLSGTAVLLGDPNYSLGMDWEKMTAMPLPELPGTKEEVQEINNMFGKAGWKTSVYLNDEATESALKELVNPDILHIATHGFFMESGNIETDENIFGIEPEKAVANPLLRSGLMFTGADNTLQQIKSVNINESDDGILNAYEAMLLDLGSTRLVVLSACETGLGEIMNGEGVFGLQRAFQVAGADAVIISLWQVSDEVTRMLMINFYRNWLESGNKNLAFHKAQLMIKKDFPAPFYWGAFVLITSHPEENELYFN